MGQAGFLCVLLLLRQDGWFCAKLDGRAWAATVNYTITLLVVDMLQSQRALYRD